MFDLREEELGLEYCLSFVRERTAAQVVERLGGTEVAKITGLAREERYRDATGQERGFALVADLPGGAMIVEVLGCRALFADTNGPLSQGTSVAVVRDAENSDPAFLWVQDGETRVSFNPDAAGWREGSDPDALLDELERLDFDLADEPDYDEQAPLRALALAEHVTGLQIRAGMLRSLTYSAVSLPATPEDTFEAPPIQIRDANPTVDAHDTVSLDGIPGAAFGEPLIIEPYSYAGLDLALAYSVQAVRQQTGRDDDTVRLFVKINAVGVRGRLTAGPHDFAFVAADGALFESVRSSDHPSMDSIDLSPGEQTSGELMFLVPPDTVTDSRLPYGRMAYVIDGVPLGWWALNS